MGELKGAEESTEGIREQYRDAAGEA